MRKLGSWFVSCLVLTVFAAPAMAGGFKGSYQRIPGWDGAEMGAFVMVPKDQGPGPFPLLVMPASWGAPNLEYVGRGAVLAGQGYVVVSYTSRGFYDSAGQIDIAGPGTVEDVSAVIDWALAHTPSNPAKIGASGISYGAGISLLAAERDPRIKAVAALSGWADLEASLYANRTVSQQGAALLVLAGSLTGRPGPELAGATARIALGDFDGAVNGLLPVVPQRSPITDAAALNRNGTAVFLANAFNDSLFPPGQYIDFYTGLSGPKQLLFAHGDHATVEVAGALGLPNEVYTGAVRWFDHHLKGIDNGVEREPAVRLKSQDGDWRGYADWNAVQTGSTVLALSRPSGLIAPTGELRATPSTGWSHSILTGLPTVADSGIAFVSGFLQSVQVAPQASIPLVLRAGAGVWQTPMNWLPQQLSGMPKLHVTVTPSQSEVSLFAYLYSVDLLGNGTLLSHKPYSLRGARPGVAQTIDLRLEATSWDIPAGRRLVLVVDTQDPRYTSASTIGGSVSFSSPASDPSTLTVPLR
ncbi:CocE/NonD family hydrolase [Lysobacter capsici]|uniref:CocE/NonD family hydrolase n=1 Tax=Lysobacter capsici TaxID=435897 RepID=UPI001C0066E8|nr:CocE/NonD family hydrolase [Lysobacter capsici]QWF17485.1 X-Pro dipeptidyl-peptidase [Lysobacter capsici]